MALLGKRLRYDNDTSSSGEDTSEGQNQNYENGKMTPDRPKRKPTCFTKNALMARENRLRKKVYVSNLEDSVASLRRDNKKLSLIVDNQSSLIIEMKKEIKYLKSVIANSSDISRLIRNIHQSSGMSVSSSLDENLSLKNSCIPKQLQSNNQKSGKWKQVESLNTIQNELSEHQCNLVSDDDFGAELFKDLDLPLDLPNQDLLNDVFLVPEIEKTLNNDHNYTLANGSNSTIDDVGVCLHVSKHHVSLEFCPTCSEKAIQSWDVLLKLSGGNVNNSFLNHQYFKSLISSLRGF